MAKETNVKKRMEQILDDTRTIPPAFGRRGWVTLLVCSLPLGYFASAVQLAPAQTRPVASVVEPPVDKPPARAMPVQIAQARPAAPKQIPSQAAPAPTPAPAAIETPYQKWVGEDVRWIISDEERLAFIRLQTDDERQAFIEQFWLRRDPARPTLENDVKEKSVFDRLRAYADDQRRNATPGTQENEMKEEHYRRHRLRE